MRRRRAGTIQELRRAIDCLPRATKIAMLDGIRSNEIIVGAYTNGRGVCPMLAAHRAGGRTSLISFARTWDRFALPGRRTFALWGRGKARRATERELLILTTHLEASLLQQDEPADDLKAAIGEHRQLLARRRARPGEPDRRPELNSRPGWSWMRLVRRLDEYERTVELLREQREPELV